MPLYTFHDKETDEIWTDIMSISDKEEYLENNQHIEQYLTSMNIVRGVGGIRNDGGWKENMQRIAEAHPTSSLAASMGSSMSAKEVKTRQAVEKWRKKRAAKGDSV